MRESVRANDRDLSQTLGDERRDGSACRGGLGQWQQWIVMKKPGVPHDIPENGPRSWRDILQRTFF